MNVLVYLIPAAVTLGLLGLISFLWSVRSGQYEDLDGAAERILHDEDRPSASIEPVRPIGRSLDRDQCSPGDDIA